MVDGMTLAKHLRQMGNTIPIIFVTVDSLRAADGYLVEAMGFLWKPIDEGRLSLITSVKHTDEGMFSAEQWNKILSGIANGSIVWED